MAARPATRRDTGQPATGAPRPIVRDLTRGGVAYRIDWDVRTAYDFVFSMSGESGSTDDLPAADREWLKASRAAVEPDVQAAMKDLFENELAIHAGVLLVDRPDVRTSADFVALVADLSTVDFLAAVFADDAREGDLSDLIGRAIDGDDEAVHELAAKLPDYDKQRRLELLKDPDGTKLRIDAVFQAWQVRFAEVEPRVADILVRDFDGRAGDRERLSPADLIEATTGGIRYLPEAGISRVILGPSYFARPYNFLMSSKDWRFFGYPVADAALEPTDSLSPPLSVVRLHRALGDDTRLRILKLLASRDLYLTEIAQQLDLSKPTIKHHLSLLRSAGLVTITESGTVMYYSLRRNRLDDASAEIKAFLVG